MLQSVIGFFFFILVGFLLSQDRRHIDWLKIIRWLFLQIVLIFCFRFVSFFKMFFQSMTKVVAFLNTALSEGTQFIFGYLAGGTSPFLVSGQRESFILFFQALPMIVLISALSMLAFHWRILPFFIRISSFFTKRILGVGAPLGAGMVGKIFLSQTDVPFLVRPYLQKMSKNELFSLMTAGMATSAIAAFFIYDLFLKDLLGGLVISVVLEATLLNILSALIFAEIIYPSLGYRTQGQEVTGFGFQSTMEAISKGTTEGWSVMINVASMMMVTLSLIFIAEQSVFALTSFLGYGLSLQKVIGYCFMPFVWLMGISFEEALIGGQLLGVKTLLNEVVCLSKLYQKTVSLSSSALGIVLYPLVSFGNFSSVGIQMATFFQLIPERKDDIIHMVLRALWAATLAGCFTGALVNTIQGMIKYV